MRWPMTTIPLEDGNMTEAQAPFIISASRSTDIPAFMQIGSFIDLKLGTAHGLIRLITKSCMSVSQIVVL